MKSIKHLFKFEKVSGGWLAGCNSGFENQLKELDVT
jgi:hypothetical protein